MDTGRHWKTYMDKNFIGSWTFPVGADLALTIAGFELKEAWNEKKQIKEPKFSIFFAEKYDFLISVEHTKDGPISKPMAMIINNTNGSLIERVTGEDSPENWVGKLIQIGVSDVRVGGKTKPAIRVRDISSKKLSEDYSAFVSGIEKCQSRSELTAIMNKNSIFKPFSTEVQGKIKSIWNSLPKETSQTSAITPTI